MHFFADDPADAIAAKALRVNLSDLAAKGARCKGFVLALALPADLRTEAWLAHSRVVCAMTSPATRCPLLGGDTVSTPGPLTISVTAFGAVPAGRMVPRTGARPGDLIYVSGTIGDAALGLRLRLGQSGLRGRAPSTFCDALPAAAAAQLRLRPRCSIMRAPRWMCPMASPAIWRR